MITKLGLAGASYELVAAIPEVVHYFGESSAETKAMWQAIAQHEEALQKVLLDYLNGRDDVRVFGHRDVSQKKRVPVVSFSVSGWDSKELVTEIEKTSSIGCRYGHFYSKRLVDEILGLHNIGGAVRVSMVHYNSMAEIEGFVNVLDATLKNR